MTGSLADLAAAWDRVIATRDASPPDCACRAVTEPLIAEWQETLARGHAVTLRTWENLRRAQESQSAPARLPGEDADWTLDVRTPKECAERPRPGAANIPVDELRERLSEVPLGARVVVFCQSGLRAARAVEMLRGHGFFACNGHEGSCPLPEVRPVGYQDDVQRGLEAVGGDGAADPRMGWPIPASSADPRMGAAGGPTDATSGSSGDLLSGLLGTAQGAVSGVIGGASQEAGRQVATGATEATRGAIPALVASASEAVRGELPALAQAGGAAAAPVVTPIAEKAGEAAGRGAARGASGEAAAWGIGEKLAAGAVGVLAILGIGYAATRKGKKT